MICLSRQLTWLLLTSVFLSSCTNVDLLQHSSEPVPHQAAARLAANGQIVNIQTGKTYTDLQQAFNELPATFDQDYELQLSGTLLSPSATLRNKKMGSFSLALRGVDGQAVLDANEKESAVVFNGTGPANIRNIILENLVITNYSQTSGNTAGVRFFTVKGQSLLKNVRFTGGYVAMRATVNCEDITLEDVQMEGIRFGGPRFGQAANDVGNVVFRRLKTSLDQSESNLSGSDNVCQLKGFKSLLIEDCTFDGATKTIVDLYEMSNVTIRRNTFIRSGSNNLYGTALQLLPASGSACRNITIEDNLFDNPKATAIYLRAADYKINNNTFIEGGTSRPLVSLEASSGTIELVNNIYYGTSNTNPIINLYQVNATSFVSDYNLFYKPSGSGRLFIKGSNGKTDLSSSSLAQLQSKGLDRNSLQAQPLFNLGSDPVRPPYMLAPNSPGRNAGDRNRAGTNDLTGKSTEDDRPDMGAYDYDSF
ncbi:right-handed parallel beta-helix repeat-containing protein [Spirosoma taeanense]|uniref:Right-handed parallel beta-helix repeat-containing protein n=1 Tax=Spirosoma taeanense TaxID=2735870 RepID=A0A6M5Y9A9_9BACT|nr:right-handed parallel beta-helix repeat-containing protein [Spirosoma taeanense]QJW89811.1 right-handed parallel beta-helix repeat-containing protein [Spirosoma taeanense]